MATPSPSKVVLVPWDPDNEEQVQRMQDQRLACGFRTDEVPAWREKHRKGVKAMYWVVSALHWHHTI